MMDPGSPEPDPLGFDSLFIKIFRPCLYSMRDLISPTRNQAHVPCSERQSLNQWAAIATP